MHPNISAGVKRQRGARRGTSMIEFCLLVPWYIFLFVGTFDFGFYAYSLIATSAAARVSAGYCAASSGTCPDNSTSCTSFAIGQLKYMPNIGTAVTTCNAAPLTVTVSYPAAASCPDTNPCTTVTVVYVTPQLVPIPGVFPGQLTITKAVTMRLMS